MKSIAKHYVSKVSHSSVRSIVLGITYRDIGDDWRATRETIPSEAVDDGTTPSAVVIPLDLRETWLRIASSLVISKPAFADEAVAEADTIIDAYLARIR